MADVPDGEVVPDGGGARQQSVAFANLQLFVGPRVLPPAVYIVRYTPVDGEVAPKATLWVEGEAKRFRVERGLWWPAAEQPVDRAAFDVLEAVRSMRALRAAGRTSAAAVYLAGQAVPPSLAYVLPEIVSKEVECCLLYVSVWQGDGDGWSGNCLCV